MSPFMVAARRRAEVRAFLYRIFLRSPEWRELREKIKEHNRSTNDGYLTCERCRQACESSGHCVHHVRYDAPGRTDTCWPSGWLPFIEENALQLLCTCCHRFVHGRSNYDPLNPPVYIRELEEMVDRILAQKVDT